MTDKPCVLVLGATGLFGGLLARRLVKEKRFTVVGAARGMDSLNRFKEETGAEIVLFDRDEPDTVNQVLATLKPFAVVDCAGPFQFYGAEPYRFAKQVIRADCHYIDIADACDFVSGIDELDVLAKQYSKVAISGMSSTPAISSAVADKLTQSLTQVVSIETAIIPGNKARRTYSVMKAVLSQIGKPYEITRYGKSEQVFGWSETRRINLSLPIEQPVKNRLASLVHTPDDVLFPQRYGAQTVTLRAGLEIKWFHHALELSSFLVRWRLIRSIAPLTTTARWIASFYEGIGSDVGGMQVVVVGKTNTQSLVKRTWDLVASDGDGPEIPTLPVSVILDKLQSGFIVSGARSSPGEINLSELEPQFQRLNIQTKISEDLQQPLFRSALGDAFDSLPLAVQQFHSVTGRAVFEGRADSKGAIGISGRIAAWLFRFPSAAKDVPIKVTVTADEKRETWVREIAGASFKSHLILDSAGAVHERFGPIRAKLDLNVLDDKLMFPISAVKLFGFIPLFTAMLPVSVAHESIDEQGRFVFDVQVESPLGARIAHYRGYLQRQEQI